MASTIAAVTTGGGGVITTADSSGNLSLLSGVNTVVAVTSTGVAVTGTLTTTGNTILGDASTDTLNVGNGGLVKDASGNVGIGTSSPTAKLTIEKTGGNQITVQYNNSNAPCGIYTAGTAGTSYFGSNLTFSSGNTFNYATTGMMYYIGDNAGIPALCFGVATGTAGASAGTASTTNERMRIDTSGNLLVACSATPSASVAGCQLQDPTVAAPKISVGNISSTTTMLQFLNANGSVGSISTSGSATAYNTSSDYRLKDNVVPMTGALTTVSQLKPSTFNWKTDGSDGQGFIAHELQAVVPDCVSGEKDATSEEEYEVTPAVPAVVDAEGVETTPAVQAVKGTRTVPSYQGIDTSFLVATLTAAIQEQQALITQLQADVAALKELSA